MSEWIVEADSIQDVFNIRRVCFKHFIRCMDCKYSYIDDNTRVCGIRGFFVKDSFYCADGERKEF